MPNEESKYESNKEVLDMQSSRPGPASMPPPVGDGLQFIRVNEIRGPLVILFGPREIGKTVTLLRLCAYLKGYDIRPNISFREDTDAYQKTIAEFEQMRASQQFAPDSTGVVNFLLLDVVYNGNLFCQILEAPGEHFFDKENPNREYPPYLNQILKEDYRKVFVFFFEPNMFNSDRHRDNYANKITSLINNNLSSANDRIVIVSNKCDLQPYIKNRKPIVREYRKALYRHSSFKALERVLRNNGFRQVSFIPFSSGTFNNVGQERKVFVFSPDHYPKSFWNKIHECIQGKPWWRFW